MASVTEDLLEGSRARRTINGWHRERLFNVADVDTSTGDLLKNAAEDGGVPQLGDEYPTDSTLILVEQIPTAISTTAVEIRLLYRVPTPADVNPNQPDAVQIEVGTTLRSIETNKDITSTEEVEVLLEVSWSRAPDGQSPQPGMLTKDVPITTLIFRRRESSSPGSISRAYTGTLNAEAFQGSVPGTWRCSSITGSSNDNGENYDVTYTFEFLADGWKKVLAWTDPDTGKAASGDNPKPSEGDGFKTIDVYTAKDWTEMNLPNG